MDGRAWRRSVKRCSASRGAARLANAAARPGAAREAQGGRACSVRAHDAPRRGVGRLWRRARQDCRSFFESSSPEVLAPCAATHPILRSSVRERHSVRAKRGGVAPFPPSLTLFAPILFPRAQSVFLPRRRARWEARLAGGPRTAQARGLPARMVGQGAGRLPVRQKNPAGAPKAREAEHGRGMGGSARGGRGRRGGRPPLAGN